MANFELRIYVIPAENIDEVIENNGIHDTSELTDTQFVEVAEELGIVYSLGQFLSLDVFAPDTDVIRAYFIDKDNEDTAPVRADGYETTITASKITCTAPTNNGQSLEFNKVLFEEQEKITKVKGYIILVRNNGDNTVDEVIEFIENIEDVVNVDILEQYNEGNYQCIRMEVEVKTSFNYNILEDTIDNYGGLDCEFLERTC